MNYLPRILAGLALTLASAPAEAPLFRDFVGINGHTVQFKPELYKPVCRIVRDYHPVEWDLQKDTATLPEWPFAKNRVSWEKVYGSWAKEGLKISACLMIDGMEKDWKDMEKDAHAYARSFAQQFGPGGKWPHVDWVEIGNEPGLYDDATFKKLFVAMAKGLREGNPKLKIVTCNAEEGKSDRYWKSADLFRDVPDLWDVIQIHRYAISQGWPVWRRSHPEDATVPYLSSIQKLIDWRDAHAMGKPVWVTEFGWDCSTKKPDPKGEWAKWEGSTDEDQARWLVRSFLLFSAMKIDKAFVYFFNDEDTPSLHAASGITRNFQPKPSYHSLAWMLSSLQNHRFSKVEQRSEKDGFAYHFTPENNTDPSIVAVWRATDSGPVSISTGGKKLLKAEEMPMKPGPPAVISLKTDSAGKLTIPATTNPILVWLNHP